MVPIAAPCLPRFTGYTNMEREKERETIECLEGFGYLLSPTSLILWAKKTRTAQNHYLGPNYPLLLQSIFRKRTTIIQIIVLMPL